MSKAHLSYKAREDFAQIWDYIAVDSPRAADRMVAKILETCEMLARNPHAGELSERFGTGIRVFTVRPYVIVFEPVNNGAHILRVVHSARDLDALFETE
jgi:toxin ParE1/3/4